MKKFLFFFIILIIIVAFHICASASSIQDPALWPAIDDITKTGDVYTFKVNVRAYCPRGLSGNLLVAAYDGNERLLDVVNYGVVAVSQYILTDNCPKSEFLEKTSLTVNVEDTASVELKLKEKDNVIIKAFVMNFDTLTPKIPSGEITFKYNNGDSEVIANYTLKSDYTNVQLENNSDYFYYYYYYDGEYDNVEIFFNDECEFNTDSTYFFTYYNKKEFTNPTKSYYKKELADVGKITCTEIPGIKIANYLNTESDRLNNYVPYYLTKYGFETTGITVHCDFSNLE